MIQWTPPYDRGDTVTGYVIRIEASDGSFKEEMSSCDGSNPAIVATASCVIPSTTLVGSPHSLAWGATVKVKLLAYNSYGNSAESPVNSNIVLLRIPDAPVVSEDESQRKATEIGLEWT